VKEAQLLTPRRGRSTVGRDDQLRRSVRAGLTVCAFLIPVVAYFWLISADAVDMLRADQWFDISLIRRSFDGTLGLSTLWAQHGENRVFIQNVLTVVLAHVAHDNVLIDDYISAVMLVASAILVIVAHRRRSPSTPWIAYWPVAIMLFSLAQGGALYGYALGWYIIMLSLAAVIFFLDRPALPWVVVGAAAAAALAGSVSSIQGLFVWPAGLVLLLQRARPPRVVLAWVGGALATTVLYFYGWDTAQGGSVSYAIGHPVDALKFFVFVVGDVIAVPTQNVLRGTQYGIYALGLVIVGIALWALISFGFRIDRSSARPVGVSLVWFGVLFAGATAAGRVTEGLSNASYSLYVMFDLLILVGAYLVVIDRPSVPAPQGGGLRWVPLMTVAVALTVSLQVVLGTVNGLSNARGNHQFDITAAIVTANIQRAPDGLVESQLGAGYESAAFIRQMTAFARARHLSLFSTTAAAWYARQALPVNRTPPATSMVAPTAGATVHGKGSLVASASDPFGVTGVDFVLRGQAGGATKIIAPGAMTPYGWIGKWDTRTVANGIYDLRSVAYAPGGLSTASPWIAVKVAN
jgi:hypothetical protein